MKWRLFLSLLRYAGLAGRAVYGTKENVELTKGGEVMNKWSGVLTARWIRDSHLWNGYQKGGGGWCCGGGLATPSKLQQPHSYAISTTFDLKVVTREVRCFLGSSSVCSQGRNISKLSSWVDIYVRSWTCTLLTRHLHEHRTLPQALHSSVIYTHINRSIFYNNLWLEIFSHCHDVSDFDVSSRNLYLGKHYLIFY